jgi:hypothetical protein
MSDPTAELVPMEDPPDGTPVSVESPHHADPEGSPYGGVAAGAAPPKIQEILDREVDELQVDIREDGVVYLPASVYRARLFEAFGSMGWAMVPVQPPKVDRNKVLYHGRLYCHGRFIAEKIGEHEYYEETSMSESVDAAESECMKKCCKNLIGGFLPLWDKDWILRWQARYAVQVWRKPKPGKKNKPSWRRKDRPAFYDETGYVKEQKQQKPVQEGQSAARGAAGMREDMGLDVKEDDPVATEARRQRFEELMNYPVPVELEGIKEAISLADTIDQLKDKRLVDQSEAMKKEDKALVRSWWAVRHKEITEAGQ